MLEETYLDLGGTIRSQSVNTTLDWLKPLLKKMGITRVANITGLDCLGIPVAISIRPNSKHLAVSQGKGLTLELAMASAIMESAEGYHVENPAEPVLHGTYNQLVKSYPVINPELFLPGAFTISTLADYEMGWIEAIDISRKNKSVFIPHVLSCLDTTTPHPEYSFLFVTTNGLAAGNTKEEAICHALYEIIERDSLCCWGQLSNDKIAETQLKIETIDSKINTDVLEKFKIANQLIKIWEITSELGVPSFHCVIKDANPIRELGMFRGTGTHLSVEIALSRALTEAAQSRLTLISGTRDDVFSDQYNNRTNFMYSKTEYEGKKDYQDCRQPDIQEKTKKYFQKDIQFLSQQLSRQGFNQILVVDHTKPELNIPVVQVFIPGLQFNGARI